MRRRRSVPVYWRSAAGFLPAVWLSAQPRLALGCTACFGQSDSPLAAGMNWAILSLLGFIVVVLGGVALFFVFLAKRSGSAEASAQAAEPQTVPAYGGSSSLRGGFAHPAALARRRRHCPESGVVTVAAAHRSPHRH